MLMLSVMSLNWAALIRFIYNIQHECLAHGSAQPSSRFFLAHIKSRGCQLRYVDDVCIILSRYFLAYLIWTLDPLDRPWHLEAERTSPRLTSIFRRHSTYLTCTLGTSAKGDNSRRHEYGQDDYFTVSHQSANIIASIA